MYILNKTVYTIQIDIFNLVITLSLQDQDLEMQYSLFNLFSNIILQGKYCHNIIWYDNERRWGKTFAGEGKRRL